MTDFTPPRYHALTRRGSRFLLHLLSNFRMIGRENFPPPPFIIISNHMSYFDAFVAFALSPVDVPALTAKKYQHKLLGKLLTYFATPIWIEQSSPDRHALKAALANIENGYALGVAPEGTRSHNNQLKAGLDGAAFLIRKAQVPIVPSAIIGTDRILKNLRPQVIGRVGKPFRLPDGDSKPNLAEDTTRLMCSIAALLPERYHGFYAGNPMIEEMGALVR